MRRNLHVCAQDGCPTMTQGTHCPEHRRAPWAGSTRLARLPPNWPALRAHVLKRDRKTCYLCGAQASQVDHRVASDDHSPANLAAICIPCHLLKSALEGNTARWGSRSHT